MQMDSISLLEELKENILKHNLKNFKIYGKVTSIKGLNIVCEGLSSYASIGAICRIYNREGSFTDGEVVSVNGNKISILPYNNSIGIGVGCKAEIIKQSLIIKPSIKWKGRVINYLAQPIDNLGFLQEGEKEYNLRTQPLPSHQRRKVGGKLDLGIKSLNLFTTFCYGQRIGIFAGSGVGKSMLMSMITKYAKADIKVIGLIGERGREVKEFLEDYLGEEGLQNAVIIVATSDESAVARRQAAYLTLTVSEFFRDQGMEVLCMMDSVTRFAMAQREIGLANGEPPTSKGYTPTVFAELPKLLERAGPGTEGIGNISGLFTVLVDGDDNNEPVADAVRGILDGHIVMERAIAERGRFPAVNVLKSVSRTLPKCNSDEENNLINLAKKYLSEYENMADMIKIGAYKKGSNPDLDQAIVYYSKIEELLLQKPSENFCLQDCYNMLYSIFYN